MPSVYFHAEKRQEGEFLCTYPFDSMRKFIYNLSESMS